jgi:hypothetical protein
LKNALIKGEISVNKLARIASVATKENEEELANKAKILSKSALDMFVKDVKMLSGISDDTACDPAGFQNQNGFCKPEKEQKSLPGQINPQQLFLDVNAPTAQQSLPDVNTPMLKRPQFFGGGFSG